MTVVVDQVTVAFAGRVVLDRVSVAVNTGEIVAITGASGSGKSTLLRVIAGLITPHAGRVLIDGNDVTAVPTHLRNVGLVFQDNQLFANLDVAGNVAFGLRMRGWDRARRAGRVAEVLELVGLRGMEARAVGRLSGGEAKRVALARSLAPRPGVLLLDEPLTGLDRALHDRLLGDLNEILRGEGTTALLVTHDPGEAAALASRTVALPTAPASASTAGGG